MTFTPDIIAEAYRESNILAIGAAPTTAQAEEGLRRLNVIVSGVYGFEVGDPLMDWPIGRDGIEDLIIWTPEQWTYPPPNTRFILDTTEAQTVYLLPNPSDGARIAVIDPLGKLAAAPLTLDGNGRAIEGQASITLNTDNLIRLWLYRSDLGDWVRLNELTGDPAEEFPFPMKFDDFFITRLAMRLNPRYGRSLSEETKAELLAVEEKLQAQYKQDVTVWGVPAVAALTRGYGDNRYIRGGQIIGDVGNTGNFGRRYRPGWMN